MSLSIRYFYMYKGTNLNTDLTAYTVPVIYDNEVALSNIDDTIRERLNEDVIDSLNYDYRTSQHIFTTSTMPSNMKFSEEYYEDEVKNNPNSIHLAKYVSDEIGKVPPGTPFYKNDYGYWMDAFNDVGPIIRTPYGTRKCQMTFGATIGLTLYPFRNINSYSVSPSIFYAVKRGSYWYIYMLHSKTFKRIAECTSYSSGFTDKDENPYTPQLTEPYGPDTNDGPIGGGGNHELGGSDNIAADIPNGSDEKDSSSLGLFTRYAMTASQLINFANKLYADNLLEQLGMEITKFLWNSPIEGCISCLSYPFSVTSLVGSTAVSKMKLGALELDLSGSRLAGTFAQINWGSIALTEYWENFLDYAPHTKIELYLPWSTGFVEIDPHEVLPGSIGVVTNIELAKGTCHHIVTGNNGSVIGVFSGACATSLPLTAQDTSGKAVALVTAAAGLAVAATTGGAGASAGIAAGMAQGSGATLGAAEFAKHVSATKAAIALAEKPYKAIQANAVKVAAGSSVAAFRTPPHVVRNGSFNGNGAGMGIQYPYIILSRPVQNVPKNYGHYYGYPSNIYTSLGGASGYTEVGSVHLDGISCTSQEREEIANLLRGGVIL